MPEISRYFGIIIAMFLDEHNPPHFHARYGKHGVAIEVRTLKVLEGRIPPTTTCAGVGYRMGFSASGGAASKLGVGSPKPALEQNRTFGVGRLVMQDVVSAVYKGDYRIEVTFEDGKKGIVDFAKYLEKGGVFNRLKDKDFFARFEVNQELGTLSWQNEIDVAPETLYAEATGSTLPEWMEQ